MCSPQLAMIAPSLREFTLPSDEIGLEIWTDYVSKQLETKQLILQSSYRHATDNAKRIADSAEHSSLNVEIHTSNSEIYW